VMESDDAQPAATNSHQQFQVDKFVLEPKVQLTKDFYMAGELEFTTTTARVEEMYGRFMDLPLNSYLQVGFDERFTKANKQFDMMEYPNRNHSISGGTTRMHLFELLTRFLRNNLAGPGLGAPVL